MAASGFNYVLENILKPAGVKVGGFPQDLFLDITEDEADNWQCNVCYMIANDARECSNSHLFCAACVFAWSMTGSASCDKCPVCRTEGNHYKESKKKAQILDKRVKCSENGCSYKGPLKFFINHHNHGKEIYHNDDMDWIPIFSQFTYQGPTPQSAERPHGMTLPPNDDLSSLPYTGSLAALGNVPGPPGSVQEDMRLLRLERLAMIERERQRRQTRFHQMRRQMMLGRVLLQHMIVEMQVDLDHQREGAEGTLTDEERVVRMQEIRDLARQLEEISMILSVLMINTTPSTGIGSRPLGRPLNSAGESVILEPDVISESNNDSATDDDNDDSTQPEVVRVLTSNVRLNSDSEPSSSNSEMSQTSPRSNFFFNDRSSERSNIPRLLNRGSITNSLPLRASSQTETTGNSTQTIPDRESNSTIENLPVASGSAASQFQNTVTVQPVRTSSSLLHGRCNDRQTVREERSNETVPIQSNNDSVLVSSSTSRIQSGNSINPVRQPATISNRQPVNPFTQSLHGPSLPSISANSEYSTSSNNLHRNPYIRAGSAQGNPSREAMSRNGDVHQNVQAVGSATVINDDVGIQAPEVSPAPTTPVGDTTGQNPRHQFNSRRLYGARTFNSSQNTTREHSSLETQVTQRSSVVIEEFMPSLTRTLPVSDNSNANHGASDTPNTSNASVPRRRRISRVIRRLSDSPASLTTGRTTGTPVNRPVNQSRTPLNRSGNQARPQTNSQSTRNTNSRQSEPSLPKKK